VVATALGSVRFVLLQGPGKPRPRAGALARGLGWRVGGMIP
jgi:hypothetical protein